jgi:hypothetical protein
MRMRVLAAVLVGLLVPQGVFAAAVILPDVPAYNWYHGCSPTAAGSIMGYWDLHGYSNLFDASGWAAVSQTANVQDLISSPAHNAKYDARPDRSRPPTPPKTSIADFLGTSVGSLAYGATKTANITSGMTGYANYRGYASIAQQNLYVGGALGLTWSKLTGEIDAGRPMLFDVDSNGDGRNDHSVPVFAYDDRGAGGRWYGCYTTWSENETVKWYQFRGMSKDYSFGIYDGDTFTITSPPSDMTALAGNSPSVATVPEPSTLALLAAGLAGLLVFARRRQG